MRKIAVMGTGYVGLVTGTCFAELGNDVVCVDTDEVKIKLLNSSRLPFFEPGLLEMVVRNQRGGRLTFSNHSAEALKGRDVVFIAVGTPMGEDGEADLTYVRAAARAVALSLDRDKIIVNKSTVPVETGDLVAAIIREHNTSNHGVSVVSNPEFLREGSAVSDFMQPDRIVLGVSNGTSAAVMRELYAPLSAPIIVTDLRTAEMIKYTANAFLATRISFINEIANICQEVGADIKAVVNGSGSDKRIGTAFMNAGLGFGGSCFPKDVAALVRIAHNNRLNSHVMQAVLRVNKEQVTVLLQRLRGAIGELNGRKIGVLGLAFKPNTDDVRESPAIRLIEALLTEGAIVTAHDPVAVDAAKSILGNLVQYATHAYDVANDAGALIVATDWNEYKQIDFVVLKKLMNRALILDARNIYEPDEIAARGFEYLGVGRKSQAAVQARLSGAVQ